MPCPFAPGGGFPLSLSRGGRNKVHSTPARSPLIPLQTRGKKSTPQSHACCEERTTERRSSDRVVLQSNVARPRYACRCGAKLLTKGVAKLVEARASQERAQLPHVGVAGQHAELPATHPTRRASCNAPSHLEQLLLPVQSCAGIIPLRVWHGTRESTWRAQRRTAHVCGGTALCWEHTHSRWLALLLRCVTQVRQPVTSTHERWTLPCRHTRALNDTTG